MIGVNKPIEDDVLVDWAYRTLRYVSQTQKNKDFFKDQLPLPNWQLEKFEHGYIINTENGDKHWMKLYDNTRETLESCVAMCLLMQPEYNDYLKEKINYI